MDQFWYICWALGILSIFTFYIPLFLSSIPQLQHKFAIIHVDPSNIDVSIIFAGKNLTFPCTTTNTQLDDLYTTNGLCFPPYEFQGTCNGTLISVYLANITYKSYFDSGITKNFPTPFVLPKKNDLCDQEWIMDPVDNVFVSNSRSYCFGGDVKNYMHCKEFDKSIIEVIVFGGMFGMLPVASLLCVFHVFYVYIEYLTKG